jgi:hypothetical protein
LLICPATVDTNVAREEGVEVAITRQGCED